MQEIFVILTGVSGNLGDAVIRRRVLEWSRGIDGRIHAYVGRTTPGWIEQLGFRDDEITYRAHERRLWLRKLIFGRGKRLLMFDPGEVPLGREHLKSEILFFLIVLATRLRGGTVIRPPRAVGDYSRESAFFYRMGARLSQVVLWRDAPSLDRMRVGELSPDTAFAEPATAGIPHDERRTLLVTMRGKRALPSADWFEAIAEFARLRGLHIMAMAQVDEDEVRCSELAEGFRDVAVEYRAWGARSDLEQERAIRSLYEECAFVISDRLHVLILAAKAGAIPIEIAPNPAAKIRTHFETIGYLGLSLDTADASSEEISSFLDKQVAREDELENRLHLAQVTLGKRVREALALA
ncbi:polysaccharide pyruvyl transferase family protein [Microbacterium oleivorans]|uniref:Polysaccharide pyruvyl transferase family protein n=1 Tax=Microbacterium oleivorans TaxID=273677 RepID=A0A4R5YNK9_9MICO|nr:polysaccharide pyruvyl transferase family protein [Microbacterium oleivorans]TDL46291.1 polysaccharide pyruvyl transferase family protein [Microbacterium oleivorans]